MEQNGQTWVIMFCENYKCTIPTPNERNLGDNSSECFGILQKRPDFDPIISFLFKVDILKFWCTVILHRPDQVDWSSKMTFIWTVALNNAQCVSSDHIPPLSGFHLSIFICVLYSYPCIRICVLYIVSYLIIFLYYPASAWHTSIFCVWGPVATQQGKPSQILSRVDHQEKIITQLGDKRPQDKPSNYTLSKNAKSADLGVLVVVGGKTSADRSFQWEMGAVICQCVALFLAFNSWFAR